MDMPSVCRGQKRASVPLELELGKVVNHHVSTGSQSQAANSLSC